jgi:Xaa-Pro aminopeptidase
VLKPGMILSNEPGYYKAGSYGIRIENLMYIKTGNKEGWLEFETLTLVPYAKELIDESLLEDNEKKYLHLYYKRIKNSIYQLLSNTAQQWLLENLVF